MSTDAAPADFDLDAPDEAILAAWQKDAGGAEDTAQTPPDATPAAGDETAAAGAAGGAPAATPAKDAAKLGDEPDPDDDQEEDPDEETDDEEDDEDQLPAEGELDEWARDLPEDIQAKIRAKNAAARMRIDQLKAQREAARTAREAAEQERNAIREKANAVLKQPVPLARTEAEPLADIASEEALQQEIAQARGVIQWAIDHADGAHDVPDGKGGTLSYTAAQVAKMKARAEAVLSIHAPARREYLRAHATHAAEARQTFPALYQDGTPEKQFALSILARVPELAKAPDYELLLGYMARGHQIALDERKGVQYVRLKPKANRPAGAKPPAPAGAAAEGSVAVAGMRSH